MEDNNPLNIYDTFAAILKSYEYKTIPPWESYERNMPLILSPSNSISATEDASTSAIKSLRALLAALLIQCV